MFKQKVVCHPQELNLGKLVVPNVYVNVELMKVIAKKYYPKKKMICDSQGSPFILII